MLSKIKKIIGIKTQIILFVFICICFGLFILYKAGKTRAIAFELTASDVKSFTNWSFAKVFVLLPPAGAKDIKAIVHAGSALENLDYTLSSEDFNKFCTANKLSPRLIKNTTASPFGRNNNWREISVGYIVDTIQRDSVTIDIWYDEKAQEVLYRQRGLPPSKRHKGHVSGQL